jgi:hypothetical protein
MEMKKAIKLAIEALEREKQTLAWDANAFRAYGCGSPSMEKRAKKYDEITEAIRLLKEAVDGYIKNGKAS